MLQDLQQAGEDFKEMLKEVEQARECHRIRVVFDVFVVVLLTFMSL